MPLTYIGRETTYTGKFLFHILCNLKHFGVGRMVVRKSFLERYPEPSYYIIRESRPDLTHPELKRGHIIATQVFRGKKYEEDQKIASGYKHDWALVPKDEEESYLSNTLAYEPVEVPLYTDMPPLLAKLYTEKLKKQGHECQPEDTKLFLRIKHGLHNRARQTKLTELEQSIPEEQRKTDKTWKEQVIMKHKIKRGQL